MSIFYDVDHEEWCQGLEKSPPAEARDCTCGAVIDSLLAERSHLQEQLDDLSSGKSVVVPGTRQHAEAMLTVAHAYLNRGAPEAKE